MQANANLMLFKLRMETQAASKPAATEIRGKASDPTLLPRPRPTAPAG
jgi:hypothetical protein